MVKGLGSLEKTQNPTPRTSDDALKRIFVNTVHKRVISDIILEVSKPPLPKSYMVFIYISEG